MSAKVEAFTYGLVIECERAGWLIRRAESGRAAIEEAQDLVRAFELGCAVGLAHASAVMVTPRGLIVPLWSTNAEDLKAVLWEACEGDPRRLLTAS